VGKAWCRDAGKRGAYRILAGKRGHLEDLGVDRRIILEWISQKSAGTAWTEWRQVADSCEHGNVTSGSIKRREFLD